MKEKTSELISRLHVIIDDVRDEADKDDFTDNMDAELREALLTAATEVVLASPAGGLEPVSVKSSLLAAQDYDAIQKQYTDGHGELVVPPDFLRLSELKLNSWSQTVRSLIDPESDEAKMQASRWTRGTPQKPKAMLTTDASGNRVVRYWTAGRYQRPQGEPMSNVYDHSVEVFTYIPKPRYETETSTEYLIAPLTEGMERTLLYQAAGVFMEAKKEATLADRFYKVSGSPNP